MEKRKTKIPWLASRHEPRRLADDNRVGASAGPASAQDSLPRPGRAMRATEYVRAPAWVGAMLRWLRLGEPRRRPCGAANDHGGNGGRSIGTSMSCRQRDGARPDARNPGAQYRAELAAEDCATCNSSHIYSSQAPGHGYLLSAALPASSGSRRPSLSRSSLSKTSGGPVNSRRDTSPSPFRSIARNQAGPRRGSVAKDLG